MALRDGYIDKGSITAPARRAFEITPADTDMTVETRGVYVGGAGDLVVRMVNDSANVTLQDVPAGSFLPLQVKRVAVATTATSIVGFY